MTNGIPSRSSLPSGDDPVTHYAREVVAGTLPAGKWHRLACQRHLRDLEHAGTNAWSYRWRAELAVRDINLFRLFRHYKGEWGGTPIVLDPWQCFIVGSLAGWVRNDADGYRRFLNAFVEVPRGSGKSTLAGGIAIIRTFLDNEPGAEGYIFATKKDQASIVFRASRQMALRSKALKEHISILKYNLHSEATESKLEALGADADTLDGLRPHIAVGDEIHKHARQDLVEVIESGMGTRRQPLLFEITTAGADDGPETVYGQHLSISQQVLEGVTDIPEWFAFIAAADPEDDWTQEETWRKANPAYGVSVKPDYLRKECAKALANPAEQAKFRRLYLGQRVQSDEAYFSLSDWDACPDLPDEAVLRACPNWIGLDLSSSVDVTAAAHVWRLSADEIAARFYFWLPEDGLEDRRRKDKVPYPLWAELGYIKLTPGNTIDRAVVRADVTALAKDWKSTGVCYDPWHAGEMTQAMQDEDHLVMIPVSQRFATLSQPTKDCQALILRRRVRHGRNPTMRWMVANTRVRKDDKENVMPCKKRSRARIDGMQAFVTTLTQALLKPATTGSIYDRRGVVSV